MRLARGGELPTSCPEPDAEAVELAVRGGLTLSEVLKAYRIGHACTWDAWLEVLEELEMSDGDGRKCIATVSRFVTQYDDRLADLVADEYVRQREHTMADSEAARFQLFRELLDGRADGVNGLDYSLDLEHIGVIAWGGDAEPALQRLSKAVNLRLFFVRAEDGLLMGWLGGRMPMTSEQSKRLREFQPPGEAAIAIGDAHPGYEGLRRTHRQAGDAHVVALRRPQPTTFYSDVSIEALALRDQLAAREFVADALRGINEVDDRSAGLRTTLSAYFECEQNATSTAAFLQVHEATIARRLSEIEKRTGRRVNRHRVEFEAALRLRSLLGPEVVS